MFTLSKKTAPFLRALVLAGLMLPTTAFGEDKCTGTIAGEMVNFGQIDILPNAQRQISVPVTVNIQCKTDGSQEKVFHICLAIDRGQWFSLGNKPVRSNNDYRQLCTSSSQCQSPENPNAIQYNFYTDPGHNNVLGNQLTRNTLDTVITVPRGEKQVDSQLKFYAQIRLPQNKQNLSPGEYLHPFKGGATALVQSVNRQNCGSYIYAGTGDERVPFEVKATIVPRCYVTARDLNFPTSSANEKNILSETQIWVTCNRGINYTIGLKSDHDSRDGWGSMKRIPNGGANVPYTLHREKHGGPLWGFSEENKNNPESNTSPIFRVNGQGNGTAQPYTVFGNVPSADYLPGRYEDTVRIDVKY